MGETSLMPPLRFTESDAELAYHEWGCNCGPAALAACLGWDLDAVRECLGHFEERRYMNPSMMIAALVYSGHRHRVVSGWPTHGLVRVQWGGPWLSPGVPPAAAYRATHWVASKRAEGEAWIYDVNGGWMTFDVWQQELVPLLIASNKRADGTWQPSHCWEVRRG